MGTFHRGRCIQKSSRPSSAGAFVLGLLCTACGQDPSFSTAKLETATDSKNDAINETDSELSGAGGVTQQGANSTVTVQKPEDPGNDSDKEQEPGGEATEQEKPKERITSITRTLTSDTFLLPGNQLSSDEFSVPSQPFQTQSFQLPLAAPKKIAKTVLGRTKVTKSISLTGPSKATQNHTVAWLGKPVDVYIVIDDSESFASQQQLRDRTKRAVKKIASSPESVGKLRFG